jgi:hypothetical protein
MIVDIITPSPSDHADRLRHETAHWDSCSSNLHYIYKYTHTHTHTSIFAQFMHLVVCTYIYGVLLYRLLSQELNHLRQAAPRSAYPYYSLTIIDLSLRLLVNPGLRSITLLLHPINDTANTAFHYLMKLRTPLFARHQAWRAVHAIRR